MKRILPYIILLSSLLVSSLSYSQDFTLIMEMIITDDGKVMSGANVNVFRDGQFVEKVTSDSKGRVDVALKPGGNYEIAIGGNFYIKKKLEVNTKNVPAEDLSGEVYFPAEVDIFKKIDGMDYSILENPIGKIKYNPDIAAFDVNMEYTKSMKSKLQQLQEDYLAQKEKEAELQEQKQAEYDEAIKLGDKAFKKEDWLEAEKQYKKAAELMPIETYPTFQLAELESKMLEAKQQEEQYNTAIQLADDAFESKDYQKAKAEYQNAVNIKPGDEYAQNRLQESQDLLANAAKVEQNYLAAIEKGDNALKVNELETAKTAFEEAAKLKPSETYPQNKLAEIESVLAKKKAKEEEYQQTIKTADDALAAKDYEAAKAAYMKAADLKPVEAYPKDQIAKVEGLMAEAAKVEQNYLAAVEKGDNALAAQDYAAAKTAFEEAGEIKPSEEYPKNKIKEIEDYLAKQEAKEEEYKTKIAEADQLLADKSYEAAKAAYEAAAKIKPEEAYPKDKIGEIETALAQLAEKEENYKAAIEKGDQALAAKDYEAAKAAYNEALSIKAEEAYPKEKLSEIETIVLKIQEADEEYNKAIADGDNALEAKDYEKAKGFYEQASSLKTDEQYPKDQIAQIDKTLAEIEATEKEYTAAIDEGDAAKGSEDLEKAIAAYEKALGLKPDASYPQQQIEEIQTKLAEQKAKEEKYQQAIAKADQALATEDYQTAKSAYEEALTIKDDDYPREKLGEIEGILAQQQEKEAAYLASIEKGDEALKAENWEEAKSAYEAALKIKKDDYPQNKIAEIDTKLAELAKAEEAAAKLEADYQAAISEGDQKLSSGELEAAKAAYEKATALKSEEEYPKTKINEIDAELKKKAEEAAEQERLAALEKEYNELIAKADQAFAADDLEAARKSYQEALALKSEEEYPQSKIEEINSTLADAAQQDQAYQAAIASADALLSEEKLEEAKKKYAEAASIKSSEQYPKDKMKEIDGKLAELAAKQEEIRLKQEQEAEKEAQYQALIAEADALFEENKLDKAKSKYEAALAVKNEEYPQNRINEIESKVAALAAEEAAKKKAEEQAKREAEFQALVAEADELLTNGELEKAKEKYVDAIGIKEDAYVAGKIAEIDEQLEKLANAEKEKEQKAQLEANYQKAIQDGDQKMADNDYEQAIDAYENALALKPGETYPQEKIAEAQAAIKANKEAMAAIQAEYQQKIAVADALMEEAKYDEAILAYEEALEVKEDFYPKNQIQKAKDTLASIAEEKEQIKIQQEQAAKNEVAYQEAIAKGDELFTKKDLEGALTEYKKAKELNPSKPYPQNQIDRIKEIQADKEAALAAAEQAKMKEKEIEQAYQQAITKAGKAYEEKQFLIAKKEYQKAIELKPNENFPKIQLDKVESELEAQRLADLEKREKEEEIKIQKGPKSTIDGDAEAEIDKMYEEIWAEREAEKKALIKEKEEAVAKYSNKKNEEEEERRQNALERIEGISVSLSKQSKSSSELHLQNYESIKQKEQAQAKFYQEKQRDSERKRNDAYAEAERLAENRKQENEQKVEEKFEGLKEDVEAKYEAQQLAEQKRRKAQEERMDDKKVALEDQLQRMQKLQKELADEQLVASVNVLQQKQEAWTNSQQQYTKSSDERIAEQQEELKKKEKRLQEQDQKRSKSYEKGHDDLIERTESYKKQNQEDKSEAESRVQKQQDRIADQIETQGEIAAKQKEGFKEGQQAVKKQEETLKKQAEEWNAESEKRRSENLDKEYYAGEDKPREDAEAADYPQGVTEEVIEGENSTTIRRIVVNGTQVDIYEKTLHNYGGVFYTKNGNNITEEVWDQESR